MSPMISSPMAGLNIEASIEYARKKQKQKKIMAVIVAGIIVALGIIFFIRGKK